MPQLPSWEIRLTRLQSRTSQGGRFLSDYTKQITMTSHLGTLEQSVLAFLSGSILRGSFKQIVRQRDGDGDSLN
jgi:hypothetical protein